MDSESSKFDRDLPFVLRIVISSTMLLGPVISTESGSIFTGDTKP